MRTVRLDSVDSTMLESRRLLVAGEPPPFVVVAAEQTGGVGRLGRKWASPRGGLWFTLAVAAPAAPDPLMSARAAVEVWKACSHAFASSWPAEPAMNIDQSPLRIKWPNDLMDKGNAQARKIAGVLIERVGPSDAGTLLCGVGINLNNDMALLPREVAVRATSLSAARGRALSDADTDALLASLASGLVAALRGGHTAHDDELMLESYGEHMWGFAQEVPVTLPDGTKTIGTILDILPDGSLFVRAGGVEYELRSVEQLG